MEVYTYKNTNKLVDHVVIETSQFWILMMANDPYSLLEGKANQYMLQIEFESDGILNLD